MAIVISVLTPDWLLHVSDAPGYAGRSVLVRRQGAPGLLSWAGPLDVLEAVLPQLDTLAAQNPADLAERLATHVSARMSSDQLGTAIIAGWGTSPEGHRASFRWRITNFEDEDADGTFVVDGDWLVPEYARQDRGRARTSFSIQISTSVELPTDIRRGLDKLPRDLRKKVSPTEIGMRLAGWIDQLSPGTPTLLALLRPDGALEGGFLHGGQIMPTAPATEDGATRLVAQT